MLIESLQQLCIQAALSAFPELSTQSQIDSLIELTQATQESFGHYQCNGAMKLAKLLQKNSREIATILLEKMKEKAAEVGILFSKMEVAGAGFINLSLDPSFLSREVQKMTQDSRLGIPLSKQRQRILIDFSSPNVAKEMHVGHLRSTIIGDALARLFEFLGHDVKRINHIGDWGTAFGMLIAHLQEKAPALLKGEEQTDLLSLERWYKESKKRFDEDAQFKRTAQLQVVALQQGDPASLEAWRLICNISKKAYQEIYDLLDVRLVDRGESFYNPMLAQIVADLESKGLVAISDGAKCIFLEGFTNREGEPLPLMVQKSDGGYNYDTTDMAAIYHRIQIEKGDRLIYVTDAGQSQHFQMIFKAAEKAEYLDLNRVKVDHVPFGLVLGADGKKFRTRSGETEKLIDLLNTAVDKARAIIEERSPQMEEEEKQHLAKALGIGAIKYADLSCHRMSDYQFSYEKMLRFEGNTAAFLMYAYVRVEGIKRKVGSKEINDGKISLEHPTEITLGLHLLRFEEVLDSITKELLPNRLTDYLYHLAEKFHAFFRDCRVEGSEQQQSRLLLCEIVARTMKQGLYLLGVEVVERM